MDWDLAIDKNRATLAVILSALVAQLGVHAPRPLALFAARLIRVMESAVRRLVVLQAALMDVPHFRAGKASEKPPFATFSKYRAQNMRPLSLFDPHKTFGRASAAVEWSATNHGARPPQADILVNFTAMDGSHLAVLRQAAKQAIWCRRKQEKAVDHASVIGAEDTRRHKNGHSARGAKTLPQKTDNVDARIDTIHLQRRLTSIQATLENLPRQARRLHRLMAKRTKAPPGPGRVPPLRPGHPPGWRKHPVHPVDFILWECDALVRNTGLVLPF